MEARTSLLRRKANYSRITAAGGRLLQQETRCWNRIAALIGGILNTAPEEL